MNDARHASAGTVTSMVSGDVMTVLSRTKFTIKFVMITLLHLAEEQQPRPHLVPHQELRLVGCQSLQPQRFTFLDGRLTEARMSFHQVTRCILLPTQVLQTTWMKAKAVGTYHGYTLVQWQSRPREVPLAAVQLL